MNYKGIRESLWRWMQLPTADGRQDNILQDMREAINNAQSEIMFSTHFWWFNLHKWTLDIVAGTTSYELDDWCKLPTRLWMEGDNAHPVDFLSPQEADRQGLRSTSFVDGSDGPFRYTIREARWTAAYSMVGNTVVANTTVTRTSGDSIVAAMVGKRLRINGEPVDYKITGVDTGANTLTIDKAYQAQLVASEAITGTGTNTTGGIIEISPGPVWRLDMLPTPSVAATINLWGVAKLRYMTEDYDVPELPEEWQEAIIVAAKRKLCPLLRRPIEEQQMYSGEFEKLLHKIRKVDMPVGGAKRVYYESSFKGRTYYPANDVYPDRRRS